MHPPHRILTGILSLLVIASPSGWSQKPGMSRSEPFRVSRVGGSHDPAVKETLKIIYEAVAKEFNEQSAREFAQQKQSVDGQRLKVLKVLPAKDSHGKLYMVGYQGEPVVISWAGSPMKVGDETPPLELEENGTRKTKVTRLQQEEASGESLGGDEVVSFFGIPLTFDDLPVQSRQAESAKVTVEEVLTKYKATMSTKVMTEPARMNRDRFLNHLKNGNTYTVVHDESRRCQKCRGFRRITNDGSGPPAPDGKMTCPECGGVGKRNWRVTYTVLW